jgi:hypothetical protein
MRTVVLADCHGRPELVTNALTDARSWDRLVFAGDFLDIGPHQDRCLALLREHGAEMLYGNHECAILYRRAIWPQHESSWEYVALFERMLLLSEWNIAAECEGVLVTHAGLSAGHAFVHPSWGAREWADELNMRFAADTSRDWFWAADSPIWFRPKNEYPALDIVQVAGHTPPHMLPTYEGFHVIDPYARGLDKSRFRYAVIEDGVVSVHDSREARAAA